MELFAWGSFWLIFCSEYFAKITHIWHFPWLIVLDFKMSVYHYLIICVVITGASDTENIYTCILKTYIRVYWFKMKFYSVIIQFSLFVQIPFVHGFHYNIKVLNGNFNMKFAVWIHDLIRYWNFRNWYPHQN